MPSSVWRQALTPHRPRITKTEFLSGKPIKTTRTMKKIYAFLMSAVALVGFAACSEGLNEITVNGNENTTEVTLFAEFEDDTRMTLNGNTPEWEKGDVIYINGVEFTAQEAGSAVQFKGTVSEDMIGQAYTAYFGTKDGKVAAEQTAVAGHMSKETPATAEIAAFESGMTIEFKNAAALLQFTPSFSGDVTFAVVGGETVTLKGCESGKTYYAAVTPATWTEGVVVTCCVLPIKSGAVGQVIERNKIYPLGTLKMPTANATWGIAGNFQGWAAGTPEALYDTGRWLVACNLTNLNGGFKFVKDKKWDVSYGSILTKANPSITLTTSSDGNLIAPDAKGYDVYFGPATLRYIVVAHGTKVDFGEPDSNKLYFKPCTRWNESSPRYAAYFFGNGEKWVNMTASANGDFYEVAKQSGYPNVIFCRMNPSASTNNWDNKWNQTADLTIPTNGNNLYTYPEITDNNWDKLSGTWSTIK